MELTYIDYLILFSGMLLGVVAHMVKKLAELNKKGILISPSNYFMKYPYQTILAVLGGLAGFFMLVSMGDTTVITYILTGYTADSVFSRKIEE